MTSFADLILPILVASVAVFVWSFLAWMVFGHHKADIKRFEREDDAMDLVKGAKAGDYLVPTWTGIDMKDPDQKAAFMARYAEGPWALIRVMPRPNFLKNLALTYVSFLAVCAVVGYLMSATLAPGEEYMRVFRIAGAACLLGFTFGGLSNDIFFGKPTRFVVTSLFDAVCYTLVAAGVFAAMWPEAAVIDPASLVPPAGG